MQPHYLPNPPSLLLTNQTSRSAPSNAQNALTALHRLIVDAGKSVVVGETSVVQKGRVKALSAAEAKRRRMDKEKRSSKKSDRRSDF
jgi:peptidyl-tRNA hydrolase ICT1